MIVLGVAFLAACTLIGVYLGGLLGVALGVKANVGGVGIAMILLILARLWFSRRGGLTKGVQFGVESWAGMYIPIVVAKLIGLDNPRSAMAYGGLMGTVSGVAGGLAATDPKLVPYGALTATFHTGTGCLVGPSILYLTVRALVG